MKRFKNAGVITAVGLTLIAGVAPVSQARNVLGSVLKGGAIGILVSSMGKTINSAINKVTGTRDTKVEASKVVPVISAGQGTYVGAVQVMGPKSRVDRVKAVAQIEGRAGDVRFRALIPVDTVNPTAHPSRVRGVGISGIIDVKI